MYSKICCSSAEHSQCTWCHEQNDSPDRNDLSFLKLENDLEVKWRAGGRLLYDRSWTCNGKCTVFWMHDELVVPRHQKLTLNGADMCGTAGRRCQVGQVSRCCSVQAAGHQHTQLVLQKLLTISLHRSCHFR